MRRRYTALIAAAFFSSAIVLPSVVYASTEHPAGSVEITDADGLQISVSGDVSQVPVPEYDAESDSYANSWRFTDGIPNDYGISPADGGQNTWSKQGDLWVCSNGTRVDGAKAIGIDVSEWQGQIDWSRVKAAGVDFAIIRCGWGGDSTSQDDKFFIQNVKGCLANGIKFGVYIYSYGHNEEGARSEANHVLRLLKQAGLNPATVELPVYYDLENEAGTGRPCGQNGNQKFPISNEMLAKMASVFCNAIENAGYEAGVYANLNWWNNFLTDPVFDNWGRWVAQYNTSCQYTSSYDIWQCMSTGDIPGIQGNVDINFDFTGISLGEEHPSSLTMYRLYNPNSGEHFYTSSLAERGQVINAGWIYEGVAWYAPTSGNPVYRLYNPVAGDHHYTLSAAERDQVVAAGWLYEGIGWYSSSTCEVPLYRVYNPNAWTGTHHYTTSMNEKNDLVRAGWFDEGISWYGV